MVKWNVMKMHPFRKFDASKIWKRPAGRCHCVRWNLILEILLQNQILQTELLLSTMFLSNLLQFFVLLPSSVQVWKTPHVHHTLSKRHPFWLLLSSPFPITSDFPWFRLHVPGRVSKFGAKKKHPWESMESFWIYWIFQWPRLLLKIVWNSSVWEDVAFYNSEVSPTTSNCSPKLPPKRLHCWHTGSAVGSVSATRLWCCILGHLRGISAEGDEGHVWLWSENHGESWRCYEFWCMYIIDDMFLCISWTCDSLSTGSRKQQVQLQTINILFTYKIRSCCMEQL